MRNFVGISALLCLVVTISLSPTPSSALVCYKTGRMECTRVLGVLGGCPIGKICSVASCCETLLDSILVKDMNGIESENPPR